MPRVLSLPRLGKKMVFDRAFSALHPRQADIFGPDSVGKYKPTKQQVISAVIAEAEALSQSAAKRVGLKERSKMRRETTARCLATMFCWPEAFSGRRGFVSQRMAFTHYEKNQVTGARQLYKGVDSVLSSLMGAGISRPNLALLVRTVLSIHPDVLKKAEFTKSSIGTTAIRFYENEFKKQLIFQKIFPERYFSNQRVADAIDHNMSYLIYLGFDRELGERKQRETGRKISERKFGNETPQERHKKKILARRDVQELITQGVPEEEILRNYPMPEQKPHGRASPKNRFKT